MGCCWSTAWRCGNDRWRAPYASTSDGRTVYPLIAILANGLLVALNSLRLLALAALLGDLTKALDASLAKAFDTLFGAPRVEHWQVPNVKSAGRSRRMPGCAVHEEATSFAQLGFDFRTLLLPLFEVAVLARVYGKSS